MTKLTQATAVAIATAASQVRGDWDHAGILHALRVEADKGTHAEDVFVALARMCRRKDVRTPGFLNQPGSHWDDERGDQVRRRGDHNQPCPAHPDHPMPCTHRDHDGDMTPEDIEQLNWRAIAETARQEDLAAREARRQEATR